MSIKRIICLLLAGLVVLSGCSKDTTQTSLNSFISEGSITDSTKEEVGNQDLPLTEDNMGKTEEVNKNEEAILRDSVANKLGGALVGCCLNANTIKNDKCFDVVTKHFSAVTFENELKPQTILGYSLNKCSSTETVNFNGKDMVVPKLHFETADAMCKKLQKWNDDNPDRIIKVRGHVLVWHSQTPEWFFHEKYDKKEPYVSVETMNIRLEWYIKSVFEHYFGESSPYKELFYGWDVVNEAISDATCTYRSEKENPDEKLSADYHNNNSSWWKVYQSNEYIINAFKYANKYAPSTVELYYNDYNEVGGNKIMGIIKLLKAVKEEEGEPGSGTRIDGMGMQGHYSMSGPEYTAVESAAKMYADVVGNVQITEFDIKASESYDGSEASKEEEYEKLRKRYKMLYLGLISANKYDYCNITGITFWGVSDKDSWLQYQSGVGGGNKTGLKQCPLLFDENYEPKSCFFEFAKVD